MGQSVRQAKETRNQKLSRLVSQERGKEMRPLIIAITLLLLAASPVTAKLSVNTVETFSSQSAFDAWDSFGDTGWISSEGGYARIGKSTASINAAPVSTLSNTFDIVSPGLYELGFDYRFVGSDNSSTLNDNVLVWIDSVTVFENSLAYLSQNNNGTVLASYSSQTDLTGTYADRGDWVSVTDELLLMPGTYALTFKIDEADTSQVDTELDIDNVYVQVIPAPGAVLLAGIGVGIVGWFRRNRTL